MDFALVHLACSYGFTCLPSTTSNMRRALVFSTVVLLMVSLIGGAHLRSQRMLRREVERAGRHEDSLPKRILWIWERPEDLRELDPSSTGVAILEATLHLGSSTTRVVRHQAILLPERTTGPPLLLTTRRTRGSPVIRTTQLCSVLHSLISTASRNSRESLLCRSTSTRRGPSAPFIAGF